MRYIIVFIIISKGIKMLKNATPDQNRLLAALPPPIYAMLLPQLELVSMPLGKVLYESGDVMRHVYFPVD